MEINMAELKALLTSTGGRDVPPPAAQPFQPKRQIVIGERGWVWVGDVSHENGEYVLRNASCIRAWGTTNGLGELAQKGKQSKTVLDPCGTVRVPEIAVIARMDVAEGVSL